MAAVVHRERPRAHRHGVVDRRVGDVLDRVLDEDVVLLALVAAPLPHLAPHADRVLTVARVLRRPGRVALPRRADQVFRLVPVGGEKLVSVLAEDLAVLGDAVLGVELRVGARRVDGEVVDGDDLAARVFGREVEAAGEQVRGRAADVGLQALVGVSGPVHPDVHAAPVVEGRGGLGVVVAVPELPALQVQERPADDLRRCGGRHERRNAHGDWQHGDWQHGEGRGSDPHGGKAGEETSGGGHKTVGRGEAAGTDEGAAGTNALPHGVTGGGRRG